MHGQGQHARSRTCLADARDGRDATVLGHREIHEHDIRLSLNSFLHSLSPIGRFGDKLDVRLGSDERLEPGPHQRVIIGHEYSNLHVVFLSSGILTWMVVPFRRADSMPMVPPTILTRSDIPYRPMWNEDGADFGSERSSTPMPSSSTTIWMSDT